MLFKIENSLRNALIVSIVTHTSMIVLAAGINGINFPGDKEETQIEMIPVSALGIGDDLTIGGAVPKTMDSGVMKLRTSSGKYNESQTQSDMPTIGDNNELQGNGQDPGNENLEGDGFGQGGSGDTGSGDMIAGSLPVYPAKAREAGLEGSLILRLYISPDGSIEDVNIRVSSGFVHFDKAAEHAVRKWRFRPVLRDGVAVSRVHDIRVKFKLNSYK